MSDTDVTLDGWEVRIVTGEGTGIVTLPSGTVLPAGGLLLLVNTDPDAPENAPLCFQQGTSYLFQQGTLSLFQKRTSSLLLMRD